jgi:hypothetical protein
MSFDDLPENWPELPLDTSGLAADVADLVVSARERDAGCLALLLTHADLTMAQPCVVSDLPADAEPDELAPFLAQLASMLASTGGALVFVRGRSGSVLLTDVDRRWHEAVVGSCRSAGVRLLGAFLATPATVRSFPEPLAPVDLAS